MDTQINQRKIATDARDLSAPLVAHWAVTYRCNLACPFCYSQSSPHREREPPSQVRHHIVRRLAKWGIFEVALGGGEPTILPDFPELLAAIRDHGIVPNVTTNGLSQSREVIHTLAKYAGTVHVSADRPELLDAARGPSVFARVEETLRRLSAHGVRWGINLLLTPDNVPSLEQLLTFLQRLGAQAVTLLCPKGTWAAEKWRCFPTTVDMLSITSSLTTFIDRRPDLRLYVDTALRGPWSDAGLLKDPEPEVLGCGGGQRHVAITPTGDVFPCSHACRQELRLGNLLQHDFHELWSAGIGYTARQQYGRLCRGTTCPCQVAQRTATFGSPLTRHRSTRI
jgi:radical SAM protein with 4Fe4S-binding SPASM domain